MHCILIINFDYLILYFNFNLFNYLKVKWSHYRAGVAQRVGRGIALLFHDRGTRRGWVVSSTPQPHFTHRKDPVPILQEAGWPPGPVWTGGKSRPHRDSIPDLQPVVNRYTDWATRPTCLIIYPCFLYIYIYTRNWCKKLPEDGIRRSKYIAVLVDSVWKYM